MLLRTLLLSVFLILSSNVFSADILKSAIIGSMATEEIYTVVTLGDSITIGQTDSPQFGYRDHLQDLLGIRVYYFIGPFFSPGSVASGAQNYYTGSSGVSGNLSTQVIARLGTDVYPYITGKTNSWVLLLIGANDISNCVASDPAQAICRAASIANVATIISGIVSTNSSTKILVSFQLPRNDTKTPYIVPYNTDLKTELDSEKATNPNLFYVDMYQFMVDDATCGPDFIPCLSDVVHPNDTGYSKMADAWYLCMDNPTAHYCNGN